ncbi:hypothetical protein LVJ82_10360 [Vitreoscilla massiliensis]|uniref:Uncharacterized protein n=1 Tax=Vitreoscilla massiliensis TaxID=1689272 RepID=A0ABY4DWK4_9NEIS|nr:hypothetical protein [Vitreoscilla massiliensis]UOO87894.1 hypothetical protein LVJ82_10360 [Vitreoscilla massiliensis]
MFIKTCQRRQRHLRAAALAKFLECNVECAREAGQMDKTCPMIATALLASAKKTSKHEIVSDWAFTGRFNGQSSGL